MTFWFHSEAAPDSSRTPSQRRSAQPCTTMKVVKPALATIPPLKSSSHTQHPHSPECLSGHGTRRSTLSCEPLSLRRSLQRRTDEHLRHCGHASPETARLLEEQIAAARSGTPAAKMTALRPGGVIADYFGKPRKSPQLLRVRGRRVRGQERPQPRPRVQRLHA